MRPPTRPRRSPSGLRSHQRRLRRRLAGALIALAGAAGLAGCGAAAPPAPRPAPHPVPGPPGPARAVAAAHVPTWAYDDATAGSGCNQGAGASPALVRAWVTYAESNCGPEPAADKALRDCGAGATRYCTPVAYLEPNWSYADSSLPRLGACNPAVGTGAPESWWLHRAGAVPEPATRLTTSMFGGGELLDEATGAVRARFAAYVRRCLPDYPALMVDDTGADLKLALFRAGGSPSRARELPDPGALVAEHRLMAAALTHAGGAPYLQVDNGLSANDGLAPPFSLLGSPAAVQGLVAEGAPLQNGLITPGTGVPERPDPDYYATLLDELAHVDRLGGGAFVVLLSYDAGGSLRARLLQQATVMLGYDGDHVVDWADLETGGAHARDLAVWPEEGIVPGDPVRSMGDPGGPGCLAGTGVTCSRGGHVDLQAPGAPGVYVREFRSCSDRGVRFGACAALVNDTPAARAVAPGWLTQRYRWQVGLVGGDVQSGGTVKLHGTAFRAGATKLAPWSAILLAAAPDQA